jgi:TPR repeat protein
MRLILIIIVTFGAIVSAVPRMVAVQEPATRPRTAGLGDIDTLTVLSKDGTVNIVALARLFAEADFFGADAQFRLGHRFEVGEGVPEDMAAAALWYRMAANNGDARGQYHLGVLSVFGVDVPKHSVLQLVRPPRGQEIPLPKDYVEAAKWFLKAAEQRNAEAQYCLGLMYLRGVGLVMDNVEAAKWIHMAGAQGVPAGCSSDAAHGSAEKKLVQAVAAAIESVNNGEARNPRKQP